MSTTSPVFQSGGLASGLDTNSIVDKLVALETAPITKNSAKQAALTVQISSIGDLTSKLKSLAATATTLSSGVAASTISAVPAGISAVAGTGAIAGRYSITVGSLATTSKARSTAFNSPNDTVAGGNITLHVQGVATTLTITPNSDLGSVVKQINAAAKGVSAAVISDGTKFYVSLSNRATGKPIGSAIDGGLTVDGDPSGLGLAVTQNATNAKFMVDNLPVESQTNDVSTAIPGVTITATGLSSTPGDLVISADAGKGTTNLQSFVDSYNSIMGVLQKSLRPDPTATVDGSNLDGSLVISLEQRMHSLLSTQVAPTGAYRTLSDIGVKLENDGTLSLDGTLLNKALANDPSSVDAIFSTASTGIADKVSALSNSFTDPLDGQLVQRTTSLTKNIKDLQAANVRLQTYVDNYKLQLQKQFATMESLISGYNSIGSFLNTTAAAQAASGSK
jgi:flagellar hook-associated protein 2